MADDAFLHGLLKDAARNFAAKAKETQEPNSSDPASQALLTQFLITTPDEETDHHRKQLLDQASCPGTMIAPTKNHSAFVPKKSNDRNLTTTTRAVTDNNSVGSKEEARYHDFAGFRYTDAVAIFSTHHLIFRGPRPSVNSHAYERLAVGAIVLNRGADKVLLVQRRGGVNDPLAGKWEMPSSLGLMANKIVATTGYHELMLPSGQLCRKYAFVVETGVWALLLDLERYLRCVWASEQNIAMGWCEGHKLEFTGKEERHLILRAFEEKEDVASVRAISN
ncbi:hypothetical protein PG997_000673 [Apiospora hydei]|uniref:Nudix hydrolase domain-containing protein n=1 Tax=Apiospora hydei TaxID=1337664 RepID=A0ABR1XBM5_9PEZI